MAHLKELLGPEEWAQVVGAAAEARQDDGPAKGGLTEAIQAFMAKYPDHIELTWQRPQRKPASAAGEALATAIGDLVTASERIRPRVKGESA